MPVNALRRVALAMLLTTTPALAAAQHGGHGEHAGHAEAGDPAAAAVHAQMGGHVTGGPHLRLTAPRPATAADSARAAAIERALLPVLARYADVREAEREGYAMFAPQVKTQRVYHFTKRSHAVRNAFGFDAARPTSLLYTKDAAGRFVLAGAMYTAPARTSDDDLDARVPLSIASWHLHTNICVPPPRARERWTEQEGGRPRFGPAGTIATEAACDAAGGRWHEHVFGWMVHANLVQTPTGPRIGWADTH